MKPMTKTIWVLCFAIAMGYLEAAVVVYLRALYYPDGFAFPLKEMSQTLAITELYREVATLVMIFSIGVLAAEYWLHRFAWFLVVFSAWDIAYYVFLKLLLNWPASLFTTDVLFLLPGIWTGPVIAPVINSLTMLLLASVILHVGDDQKHTLKLPAFSWVLLVLGSVIVLAAYTKDFWAYVHQYRINFQGANPDSATIFLKLSTHFIPRAFDWPLFISGVLMHLAAIVFTVMRRIKEKLLKTGGDQ
jgi:hypothetical protein